MTGMNPEGTVTSPADTNSDEPTTEPTVGGGRRNLRSTIAFPYASLKDAEQVAKALQDHWGGSASPEQLAASMGSSPKSGTFRTKTSTAKTFGLTETGRGQIALTSLGQQILDPRTQAAARVKAFLAVPLFNKLHDEYKMATLPQDRGLESKIESLGVSTKQTDKARQSFQRSAEHAGFFKHGRDRLVKPPENLSDSTGEGPANDTGEDKPTVNLPAAALPGPVEAAWFQLLRDGRTWPTDKTLAFIEASRKLWEVLSDEDE